MDGNLRQIGLSALISGTVASLVSAAALALLAKGENKSAVQPLNATSHWIHGSGAGNVRAVNVSHTATGYATHHGACVFWATLLETLLAGRTERRASNVVKYAALVAAIAAIVDYWIVPKRLTPGWEYALSKPSITSGFAAMAAGLALGGLLTSASQPKPRAKVAARSSPRRTERRH
jgi:hypothetical protein